MSNSQSNRLSFMSSSPPIQAPILKPALKSSRPSTPFTTTGSFPETESISPVFDRTDSLDYFPVHQTSTETSGGSVTTGRTRRYQSKVGFDTLQTQADATLFSFTLQMRSEGYKRTRSTRSYLVAASPDESGSHALDWVMESLVQDGDELIVFRGFDNAEDMDEREQEQKRQEAQDLMKKVLHMNDAEEPGRKLSVIVEFVGGKVTSSIERLIALYRPDSLVVGTRARSVLQQWGAALGAPGMGSVSRYCVSRSPVPVIVVRPEKVRKGLQKRRADPKRSSLFEGLERPHSPVSALTRPVTTTPAASAKQRRSSAGAFGVLRPTMSR